LGVVVSVTVYTLPNCVQCDSTKRVLTRQEIPFDVVDLSSDSKAMETMKSLGFVSAPVVYANGEYWSGFRLDKLNELSK
jgi:glutaredoxin-like protein NrdH